ncbi:hypothetical protein MXB_596 [Myxobolus squamalis]|nr:hypothetical protein MXB_596 [Myxobolus squamalis]
MQKNGYRATATTFKNTLNSNLMTNEGKKEIMAYFQSFFLNHLRLSDVPRINYTENVPTNLLKMYITETRSDNNFLPTITRAREIVFFIGDNYDGKDFELSINGNRKDFDNISEIRSRGALVHIRSPVEPGNEINSRSDECEEGIQCCPVKTIVDFEELGWNKWILQPKIFKLSYCSGPCNSPQNRYSVHSNILRRMIHVQKEKAPKLELCCAPHEMIDYSILYYDENGMISSTRIPDMERLWRTIKLYIRLVDCFVIATDYLFDLSKQFQRLFGVGSELYDFI